MKEIEKKTGNNVKSFIPKKKCKKNNKKQTSKKASGSAARIEY